MRIGILTFHRAYNYGAVLQCYALYKTLQNLGAECEIIDYYPAYFYNIYHMLPNGSKITSVISSFVLHLLLLQKNRKRNENFENFLDEHLCLSSQVYKTITDTTRFSYDSFIVGSDQVWNEKITRKDETFYLGQGAFSKGVKCSYAASFGSAPDNSSHLKLLNDFTFLSVREMSGKEYLKNELSKESVVSCDPTLLLSAGEWKSLTGEKPIIKDKYILLYYVTEYEKIREYAKRLSAETGIKVVCVSCFFSRGKKDVYKIMSGKQDRKDGFISMNEVSPKEFVNLFSNAEYVVTSSFHGTVFSIIFHKQFLSLTNWKNGKVNGRVSELLTSTGLEKRTVDHPGIHIDDEIIWGKADRYISEQKKAGIDYLQKIISNYYYHSI